MSLLLPGMGLGDGFSVLVVRDGRPFKYRVFALSLMKELQDLIWQLPEVNKNFKVNWYFTSRNKAASFKPAIN